MSIIKIQGCISEIPAAFEIWVQIPSNRFAFYLTSIQNDLIAMPPTSQNFQICDSVADALNGCGKGATVMVG
jgi:hypothetical protein